jgi:holo-[acyl-carrier protein] synthase
MILGIGIDIVDIPRMKKAFGRSCARSLQRVYTDAEIAYCSGRALSIQHFAARFAAKEAMVKALGTGWSKGVGWQDGEISNDTNGAPRVSLTGKAAEIFRRKGGGEVFISISHTEQVAIAQVVWVQSDRPSTSRT